MDDVTDDTESEPTTDDEIGRPVLDSEGNQIGVVAAVDGDDVVDPGPDVSDDAGGRLSAGPVPRISSGRSSARTWSELRPRTSSKRFPRAASTTIRTTRTLPARCYASTWSRSTGEGERRPNGESSDGVGISSTRD